MSSVHENNGIHAVYFGESSRISDDKAFASSIVSGQFQIVYVSPELLLTSDSSLRDVGAPPKSSLSGESSFLSFRIIGMVHPYDISKSTAITLHMR